MNRPDIEAIRQSWAMNVLYVPGDSLESDIVTPRYYLVEHTVGDSLLAYITDLEQRLAQAEKVVEAAQEMCAKEGEWVWKGLHDALAEWEGSDADPR